LKIADVIGGQWPMRLRQIAVNITQLEADEDPSVGTRLLQDIHEILGDQDWITSNSLISKLHVREWITMSGKGLANKLKPYGIEPRQERRGERVERGYFAKDFADAFARYLSVPLVPVVPDAEEPQLATGTNGTPGTTPQPIPKFKRRV
jgi:putative DNA primase/helicase